MRAKEKHKHTKNDKEKGTGIMVTTPGVLDPADPGARSLQLLLQTWCGSAPRRGPSANGYDAWRLGSCGPARKILAAAA